MGTWAPRPNRNEIIKIQNELANEIEAKHGISTKSLSQRKVREGSMNACTEKSKGNPYVDSRRFTKTIRITKN